jgi:hypothetical protein
LILAGVVIAVLAFGLELGWRARGHGPMPNDNVQHWSVAKAQVGNSPDVLVLAGSSRFHGGLRVGEFAALNPARTVVQLSVSGGSPLSVLAHLSADANFRGVVLCEVIPHHYFTDIGHREPWPGLAHRPYSSRWEDWLHVQASRQFTLMNPAVKLDRVFLSLLTSGTLPGPMQMEMNERRELSVDYGRTNLEEALANGAVAYQRFGKVLEGSALKERIFWINAQVERIKQRGGRVIFFRMISSGRILAVEEDRFPDPIYWAALTAGVGAPAIHFREIPALGGFNCPEGAHLDRQDAAPFSRALAVDLRQRGLL